MRVSHFEEVVVMKLGWLCLSVTLIGSVFCAFHTTAAQEAKERIIRRLPVEKDEPVSMTDLKVNDQSVSLDKKFSADDEWLRTLTISMRNKSDKVILYASIQLQFPRAAG